MNHLGQGGAGGRGLGGPSAPGGNSGQNTSGAGQGGHGPGARQNVKPARWLDTAVTGAEKELRSALDRVAQRGADEVALRRVWSRLAQDSELVPGTARDRGRSWWKWAVSAWLVGACTVAIVTLVIMAAHDRTRREGGGIASEAVDKTGTVTGSVTSMGTPAAPARAIASIQIGGNDPHAATSAERTSAKPRSVSVLVAPATVRTGRGETLNLSLRGGAEVTLTSESIVALDKDDRPTVTAGEVRFQVARQPNGQHFEVAARQYRVVVVGTRFAVRVRDTNTSVRVDEGIVEIWESGNLAKAVAVLRAGDDWAAPIDNAPTPGNNRAPARYAKIAGKGQLQNRANAGVGAGAGAGAGDRPAVVAAFAGRSNPKKISSAPSDLAHATSAGGVIPSAASAAPAAAAPAPIAVASVAGSPNRSPAVSSRVVSGAAAAGPEVMALLTQAKRARAEGNSRKALGLYRALADRGGPAGENAAYEMGRLFRDDLAEPREAIATWRLYRARNPRGLLRIEADISIIETLMTLSDKSGALSEASDFIRRYPEGERHAEMARLVGDLSRERGECQAAIAAYDEVLSDGRARAIIVDDVTFNRALCLLRRNPAAGVDALRVYLQRFPSGRFRNQAQRLLQPQPQATQAPTVGTGSLAPNL